MVTSHSSQTHTCHATAATRSSERNILTHQHTIVELLSVTRSPRVSLCYSCTSVCFLLSPKRLRLPPTQCLSLLSLSRVGLNFPYSKRLFILARKMRIALFRSLLVVYVLLCPVGGAVSRTLHDYVQIA